MSGEPTPARFSFSSADGTATWSRSRWGSASTSTFEARGRTRQAALESALSAALALALEREEPGSIGEGSRATPLRGEGGDLGALLADMLEELWEAVALHGQGIEAVAVDGVLRRDDGGLLAWGYALGPLEASDGRKPPRLVAVPEVEEGAEGFTIRGSLAR